MSHADHNRAVQAVADIVAKAAVIAAAKPCTSPAHRREICALLQFIADEIATLKINPPEPAQ